MTAAVIALAATVAGVVAALVAALWKLGDEKAARVYSDQARRYDARELELARASRDEKAARVKLLEEALREAGVDVPAGRGVIELRSGLRRAAAGGTDAAGDPSPVPRVSLDAPATAAAAPGGLVRGGVPGGRT